MLPYARRHFSRNFLTKNAPLIDNQVNAFLQDLVGISKMFAWMKTPHMYFMIGPIPKGLLPRTPATLHGWVGESGL